jgi:hypothetical protein
MARRRFSAAIRAPSSRLARSAAVSFLCRPSSLAASAARLTSSAVLASNSSRWAACSFTMAAWRAGLLVGPSVAGASRLASAASASPLVAGCFCCGATTTVEEVIGRAVRPPSTVCAFVVTPRDAATTRPKAEIARAPMTYLSQAALAEDASPVLTPGYHLRSVRCSPDSSLIPHWRWHSIEPWQDPATRPVKSAWMSAPTVCLDLIPSLTGPPK